MVKNILHKLVSCFWQVPQESGHLSGVKGQPETELCDQLCRSQWGRGRTPSPLRRAKCDKPAVQVLPRTDSGIVCHVWVRISVSTSRQKLHGDKISPEIPYFAWLTTGYGFVYSWWYWWTPHTVIKLGTTEGDYRKEQKASLCDTCVFRSCCFVR